MSNQLTTNPILHRFQDDEFGQVRIVIIDGEVYFFAMDVTNILGYSKTQNLLDILDSDEIFKIKQSDLEANNFSLRSGRSEQIPSIGGNLIALINESGLYHAIIKSTKPNAKDFRKKVTSVILPTIRKTGSYSTKELTVFQKINRAYEKIRQEKALTDSLIREVLDLVTHATDYRSYPINIGFSFAKIQNCIHMVATGKTSAEIKLERSNSIHTHAGMTTGFHYNKQGKLDKTGTTTARNYLLAHELKREKSFVVLVLMRIELLRKEFTVDEFVDFFYSQAIDFCENLEDIPNTTTKEANEHVSKQVVTYNANKALCSMGFDLYLESQEHSLVHKPV